MITQERYIRILNALEKKPALSINELVALVGASESTIRRDIAKLDAEGKLKRVHGGASAIPKSVDTIEETMLTKMHQNPEEKSAIARYAAEMITDEDFVYLDAGTTTERIIDYLGNTKAVFVTNGISHARRLVGAGLKTIVIGGMLRPETEAIVGTDAIEHMKKFNFTKALLGTNGISTSAGYTTPDVEEARMKEMAIRQSYVSFILADASKFGRVAPVKFGDLEKSCIITDKMPDNKYSEYTLVKEIRK